MLPSDEGRAGSERSMIRVWLDMETSAMLSLTTTSKAVSFGVRPSAPIGRGLRGVFRSTTTRTGWNVVSLPTTAATLQSVGLVSTLVEHGTEPLPGALR